MFDVVLNCTEGFLVREELENCFSLPNVAKTQSNILEAFWSTLFNSTNDSPNRSLFHQN